MSFIKGDRVAVYDGTRRHVGTVFNATDTVYVDFDDDPPETFRAKRFHPKQCRRLKPKKRREWWIGIGCAGQSADPRKVTAFFFGPKDPRDPSTSYNVKEWVHVREVRNDGHCSQKAKG